MALVEDSEAVPERAAPSVSKAQTRRREALRKTFGKWNEAQGRVAQSQNPNRYTDDRGDDAAPVQCSTVQQEFPSISLSRGRTPFPRPDPPPAAVKPDTPYPSHPKRRQHPVPSPLVRLIRLGRLHHPIVNITRPVDGERSDAVMALTVEASQATAIRVVIWVRGWGRH